MLFYYCKAIITSTVDYRHYLISRGVGEDKESSQGGHTSLDKLAYAGRAAVLARATESLELDNESGRRWKYMEDASP